MYLKVDQVTKIDHQSLVGITVTIAELEKQGDPDPNVGAPLAAGGYNTAAAHLRIDRHLLVESRLLHTTRKLQTPLLFKP
jgi:hypothetical protein